MLRIALTSTRTSQGLSALGGRCSEHLNCVVLERLNTILIAMSCERLSRVACGSFDWWSLVKSLRDLREGFRTTFLWTHCDSSSQVLEHSPGPSGIARLGKIGWPLFSDLSTRLASILYRHALLPSVKVSLSWSLQGQPLSTKGSVWGYLGVLLSTEWSREDHI